jgi:hypothetical protein
MARQHEASRRRTESTYTQIDLNAAKEITFDYPNGSRRSEKVETPKLGLAKPG